MTSDLEYRMMVRGRIRAVLAVHSRTSQELIAALPDLPATDVNREVACMADVWSHGIPIGGSLTLPCWSIRPPDYP
jgi:hypothetical protein